MLERISRPAEVRRWPGSIPVGHRYTPGRAGEVFFTALRDGGVLLGARCSHCDLVYAPARAFCERCFSELTPDTEVGPGGELLSFTIAFAHVNGDPLDVPVTYGLVRLDGADTVFLHVVLDAGDEPLEIGERVQAVLKPEADRTASILDVEGFRPERSDD
ncbi:MAG TPA: Zn-ribbon domain-containing OB-fold protein [Actinomycetota bacterium]|nr:Zn-ribbon domain-containing OB-fold protein [Actinomycetota bacterium]